MWFKILLPHQHYPLAAMIGKDGKLYFRLVDVGALLGRSKVYEFAKQFDSLIIQGKDVLPAHKQYPIMTQKSKLVTPAVVFNILNAELSSLATSFALSLNAGSALVENPSNLYVESYKTSPVLHVQDSPVPNAILVRLWIQTFIQKVQDMRRMQNGSKPTIQMVYEACMRGLAQRPERNLLHLLNLKEYLLHLLNLKECLLHLLNLKEFLLHLLKDLKDLLNLLKDLKEYLLHLLKPERPAEPVELKYLPNLEKYLPPVEPERIFHG
ncbi:uncharacterized protein TNCV_2991001 [Trichonephila clavipes]|nr:uncharacterized protein TNCV_2991001 [Trichonephila clavipes]